MLLRLLSRKFLPFCLSAFLPIFCTAVKAGGPESVTPAWMVYVGGFAGYYGVDFGYGGNYFSNNNSEGNRAYNRDIFQQAISGGGQLGIQYHFAHPYFIGAVVSGMMNSNKAHFSEEVENFVAAS